MNNIDEVKRRIKKRKAQTRPVLTDGHFRKIYNGMIKMMVILMVGLSIGAYVKVSPNGEYIKEFIFNNVQFEQVSTWFQKKVTQFMGNDSADVSNYVSYQHIKDNYYKNQTNEVLNFSKGRVIYVGEQDILGKYITVLLENNIEVTYGQLTDSFVSLYDQVDEGTIVGTYDEQVMIVFTQGEKEIDYDTFEDLSS
jgi:hypothetical protein